MGLFSKGTSGGFMDEIRCDESEYLVWKWHPKGDKLGANTRENAVRWGSSLRVRAGEAAVFVYNQHGEGVLDVIEGPCDELLETENLPILASIIGLAYAGGTPFQAEVYFINLAKVVQVPFAVPYFDLYDPRFLDFGVPTAVRGTITFNIASYQEFIRLHKLANFDLVEFQAQVKSAVARYAKDIVANAPEKHNIPAVQIERAIDPINEQLEITVRERFERDFGVNVTSVDIDAIDMDKTSEGYRQLKAVTQDLAAATAQARTDVNIKNMWDTQRINAENAEDILRIQREEAQYAQHKQTQMSNFDAYQLEQQAAVGIAGAEALGNMGGNGATGISDGGSMNPAAMMAGVAMGGVIGQNMAGIMNGMMSGMGAHQTPYQQAQPTTPPPIPGNSFYVAVNGQHTGPFDIAVLTQMASNGSFTSESLVWKQGMPEWVQASTVKELSKIFNTETSNVPGMPPIPTS